jgi:hypothetical protein
VAAYYKSRFGAAVRTYKIRASPNYLNYIKVLTTDTDSGAV